MTKDQKNHNYLIFLGNASLNLSLFFPLCLLPTFLSLLSFALLFALCFVFASLFHPFFAIIKYENSRTKPQTQRLHPTVKLLSAFLHSTFTSGIFDTFYLFTLTYKISLWGHYAVNEKGKPAFLKNKRLLELLSQISPNLTKWL